MSAGWRRAETTFFWVCGVALIVMALTSETLARIVQASGVCR